MSAQASRIDRTEAALGASVVVEQLRRSFPLDDRDNALSRFANAAIPWVPLLFLKPEKRGTGVAGVAADPRVWSLALVAGIAAGGEMVGRKRLALVRDVPDLDPGRKFRLHLTDGSDPASVKWESDDPAVVSVDNGEVVAKKQGSATVTASSNGVYDNVVVRVR